VAEHSLPIRAIRIIVLPDATAMRRPRESDYGGYEMPQIQTEFQTYPYLRAHFEGRGYKVERIERSDGIPDMFICKGESWFWVEVKLYKGTKDLFMDTLENRDLSWQPGQVNFKRDMDKVRSGKHYMLIVYTTAGERRFYIGGLPK
jgi:hypothetical protein